MKQTDRLIKLMLVIPDLKGAGAQRTMVNIANAIDKTRFDVMFTLFQESGELLADLDNSVEVVALNAKRARNALVPLAKLIRRERPDVVMSTLVYTNTITYFACRMSMTGTRLILRESNHLSGAGVSSRAISTKLVGFAYRHCELVIGNSRDVAIDCIARYGVNPRNVISIGNPVDLTKMRVNDRTTRLEMTAEKRVINVIAVGRLERQKGFDLLLYAMSQIEGVDYRLTILGEGSERSSLERLVGELGLGDRVSLPGWVGDVPSRISQSDIFVLSSRWEGFGHVIVEALAVGTPVVSFNCPGGPQEILENGKYGVLVENLEVEALATAIKELAHNRDRREELASTGVDHAESYGIERIVQRYAEQIETVLHDG